jgi:hypothetical protein
MSQSLSLFLFLAISGFELRASHLLGRCSTTWNWVNNILCEVCVCVLVSFPSLWQNSWDKQLTRANNLFWFRLLQVSVHGCLTLLPLGQW